MTLPTKINTLRSLLPDSPFVQEQIDYAVKYGREADNFEENLDLAIKIAEYAQKYSKPNFYKYRPVLCVLLQSVSEEYLHFFETETNSILVTLAEFTNFQAQFKISAKNAGVNLVQLIHNKSELLLVIFCWLAELVQKKDIVNTLKVAYIMLVLRLENFNLTEEYYDSYNKLLIAVNKANF